MYIVKVYNKVFYKGKESKGIVLKTVREENLNTAIKIAEHLVKESPYKKGSEKCHEYHSFVVNEDTCKDEARIDNYGRIRVFINDKYLSNMITETMYRIVNEYSWKSSAYKIESVEDRLCLTDRKYKSICIENSENREDIDAIIIYVKENLGKDIECILFTLNVIHGLREGYKQIEDMSVSYSYSEKENNSIIITVELP